MSAPNCMRIWSNRSRLFRNSSHPGRNTSRDIRPNPKAEIPGSAVRMTGSFQKCVWRTGYGAGDFRMRAAGTHCLKQIQGRSSVKSRLSEECLVNSVTYRRRKNARSGSFGGRVVLSSVMKNQSAAGFVPFGNPPPHLASGYFLSCFGLSQQLVRRVEQRRQQRLLLVGRSELDEQRSQPELQLDEREPVEQQQPLQRLRGASRPRIYRCLKEPCR